MSSRELLVLLAHLPEESAYKTRGGRRWSLGRRIAASTHNHITALTRIQVQAGGGEDYEPFEFLPPDYDQQNAFDEDDDEFLEEARRDALNQLDGVA